MADDPKLSQRYRELSREEPPRHLDDAIFAVVRSAEPAVGRTRTVDAHACRLRKKLSASPRAWVVNLRGVGYRLVEDT